MFEKVLAPTDFSREARNVLECMGMIPGLREVIILHVVDASNPMNLENKGWSYASLIDEAEMRLEEQASFLASLVQKDLLIRKLLKVIVVPMSGADGVNLQRPKARPGVEFVDGGSIGEAISKTAMSEKVSLIIMGAHGKGLVEGLLLGSVSTEVLSSGESDLLIFRRQIMEKAESEILEKFCRDIFKNVLIATDFSNAAGDAAVIANGLPGIQEISLIHVVPKGDDIDKPAKKLNELREHLEILGRKVTVHVLEGRADKEILNLAKKQDSSLIIMSSQGKGWLKQLRVGSTTISVARNADRPMLVIRPRRHV